MVIQKKLIPYMQGEKLLNAQGYMAEATIGEGLLRYRAQEFDFTLEGVIKKIFKHYETHRKEN